MGAPDFSRRSWRLKIERAKQHFVELQNCVRAWTEANPYRVRWESQKNEQTGKWHGLFEIGEPPEELSLIFGDVLHNVHCAFDHLAVFLTGNDDTHFPIRDFDPFVKDAAGKYVHDNARKSFEGTVDGMKEEAVAIIKRAQPYSAWPVSPTSPTGLRFHFRKGSEERIFWDRPHTHYLHVLRRLDNRDKHKRLITTAAGVRNGYILVIERTRMRVREFRNAMLEHGASVVESWFPPSPNAQVDVKVFATVEITIRIGPPEGTLPVFNLLRTLTEELPAAVFGELETCIPQ